MIRKLENKVDKEERENYIYYANELARISWNFSPEERKILLTIFNKIDPFSRNIDSNKSGNKYSFFIKKSDVFDKLEIVDEDGYSRYRKLALGLNNKTNFIISKKGREEIAGVIVTYVDWRENCEDFEVVLNPPLMDFFECLKAHYTNAPLNHALKLSSNRSLSLFTYSCFYINTHSKKRIRSASLKKPKSLLNVPEEARSNSKGKFDHSLFQSKTLDPWILEFNKLNLADFKYELLTTSKNDLDEKEVIYDSDGNKYVPSPKGALTKDR